jgi:hypothetical protein
MMTMAALPLALLLGAVGAQAAGLTTKELAAGTPSFLFILVRALLRATCRTPSVAACRRRPAAATCRRRRRLCRPG